MKKAILATKVGMTQIFNADGVLVPVTVLEAGPCSVTQIKTVENDGYSAVQVAYADKKEKVVSKDANGKKEIRWDTLQKLVYPERDTSESSNLRTQTSTNLEMLSKLISLQRATKSTLLQFPKVKVSRALSRD